MLLVTDIGNTHTVFGLMREGRVLKHWRITSSLARTEDEIGVLLRIYCQQSGFDFKDISGVCISSVVPDLTASHVRMTEKYLNSKPLVIHAGLELGMRVLYKDPGTVGADRLCNAVAGVKKYGAPLIVLDFGTATTFDCVNKEGDYLGGVIAPGIETSIRALHHKAAKLPQVELSIPRHPVGQTTTESIQVGIIRGAIHMVNGLVADISRELGAETQVIATGGLAPVLARETEVIAHVEPFLSLEGMEMIYAMNR
ncbi:MAG: type III pantothenate kinase [Calditrichaeota bacterium]|nr:MAG: type III pantothenate kinase [Calditrichota bacterium]